MASRQILVLLIAAVLCNHVMGRPSKMKDDCSFTRQKPSVGILRIRYFLFGDDSITQEELELSDLFDDREPTAGRDKIPTSGTNEQMRPTDQKGRPNQPVRPGAQMENQPTTKPPVPIPRQPEGQQINPQNPEKLAGNPPMVDPSKTGVPLPDESVNQLEQQKIQNPNPPAFAPGQSTQMRKPISELKDRNQEPLEQLKAPSILQQPNSQQPQQQFQQPQQRQPPQQQTQQQPFQPQQQPQQPQQEFQQLQQQLQQDQSQQPQQQPRQEFQPQQQQLRATERRKRWQPPPIRQISSDVNDWYTRYGPDYLYPRAEEIFRQAGDSTQRFFDGTRPATSILDDRSGIYQRPRNDGGGVDIDLNV
ncbi:hypothetical protein DAPPUDRAFT_101386 [Daphnia pulex]|uniref:Uncharacterized protein n=1 Tax=Daphnia pulex TaxID=6669 RepID=E9GD77_DAPPU|nr:hypothetical protein DAPPUDRAFT_101386 [Daphnia pulex]|eukprot:EFX82742.1 hypothetical protein DAPPUDRAFT_101386 [Daphnia pulex]